MTPRKLSPVVTLLITIATLLPAVLLWRYTVDDAYISFRYLLNFANSHGLVFNPGERVEGFSHPLWMLLLLAATFLPNPGTVIIAAAKALGLLCTLGTGILLYDILRRSVESASAIATALTLWLLAPGAHIYATCGLETPLLALLLPWILQREAAEAPRWQSAMLLGLVAITRPEAPLYVIAWLAAQAMSRRYNTGQKRWSLLSALTITALLLGPLVCWQIFRVKYYHAWLPNTFFAKPPGIFGGKLGLQYAAPMLAACSLPVLVLAHRSRTPLLATAGAFCLSALLFVAYTQGDWMPFWRFLLPVWPAALVQLAAGLNLLSIRQLPSRAACLACAVVGLLFLWSPLPKYLRHEGLDDLMYGTHQLEGGDWLANHITGDETVATVRLGGLAWRLPSHHIYDLAGLTDSAAAKHLWKHHGDITWQTHPLRAKQPDWIAAVYTEGQSRYHNDDSLTSDLQLHYRLVGSVPQGPDARWDFFRRNDAAGAPVQHP